MTPEDVPPGPLLVDTDVASYVHFEREGAARDRFTPFLQGHVLCLAFASVGELLGAAEVIRLGARRRDALEGFIRRHLIIPVDYAVALWWAKLHAKFRGQFGDSGANDMWVAASALAQPEPLPVLTNNLKHFETMSREFPSLQLIHPDL